MSLEKYERLEKVGEGTRHVPFAPHPPFRRPRLRQAGRTRGCHVWRLEALEQHH